jgi:hypothetical protein
MESPAYLNASAVPLSEPRPRQSGRAGRLLASGDRKRRSSRHLAGVCHADHVFLVAIVVDPEPFELEVIMVQDGGHGPHLVGFLCRGVEALAPVGDDFPIVGDGGLTL